MSNPEIVRLAYELELAGVRLVGAVARWEIGQVDRGELEVHVEAHRRAFESLHARLSKTLGWRTSA